jgi:MFS family permease
MAERGASASGFSREALLALLLVLSPQLGLATLQLCFPLLTPLITSEAGLRPELVGVLVGLTNLGAIWHFAANHAFTPVLGSIRALRIAVVIGAVGAGAAMTGFLPALLIGAVLIGFAYATTAPAGSDILVTHTPRRLRGTMFSIRQAGVPLGGVVAAALTSAFAASLGWRAILGLFAAICLLSGCVLLFSPRRYVTAPAARFRPRALFHPGNIRRPFRVLAATPRLLRIAAASIGFAAVQSCCFSFFVTYLSTSVGLSLEVASGLFAVVQAASIMGRVVIGWVADLIGSARRALIGLGIVSAALCAAHAGLSVAWPMPLLVLFSALAGISVASWNGLFLAEVADAAGEGEVSEATAGTTFFTFAGYMVLPPAFAVLVATLGYEIAYLATALCGLAASLILWGSERRQS